MRLRHFLPGLTITAIAVSLVVGGCGGGSNRQSGASRAAATAATGPTLFVRPVLCTLPPALRPGGANVPPESACASSNPAGIATDSPDTAAADVIAGFFRGGIRYVLGPADLTKADVKSADVIETENLGYEVEVRLTAVGLQKLNRVVTSRSPLSQEAVEVGGDVDAVFRLQARGYHSAVLINTVPISLGDAQHVAAVINASVKGFR